MKKPRRNLADAVQVATFEDARLAPLLAGPDHRWFALIEDAFGVQADSQGGEVVLTGPADALKGARRALDAAWDRLSTGGALTEGDVRAAILFAKSDGPRAPAAIQLPGRRSPVAARTPAQAAYVAALADPDVDRVFGVGPAGTGKSFLAVAAALLDGRVARLVVTRPAVEAGERLGFLPGDLNEKVDPYLQPIWDALKSLLGPAAFERRRAAGEIEVAPLAFMRGRTLSDAFVIVDEAQNASRLQMKMVLTRLGEGSRMAVNGDPSQVDLPDRAQSGLAHALRILDGVRGVAQVRFTADDVVRHPLVGRIVAAYDADARRALGEPPDA